MAVAEGKASVYDNYENNFKIMFFIPFIIPGNVLALYTNKVSDCKWLERGKYE